MSGRRIRELLSRVAYRDWRFVCDEMGKGYYVQVRFTDGEDEQGGRKWYVSLFATDMEVVQTAMMAVLAAEEHEARERFRFRGLQIFHPHRSLEALCADAGNVEMRAGAQEPDSIAPLGPAAFRAVP